MNTIISTTERQRLPELLSLYDSVGWPAYTARPDALRRGIAGSLRVATARVETLCLPDHTELNAGLWWLSSRPRRRLREPRPNG